MRQSVHVRVTDLPVTLRDALASLGYARGDVAVTAAETVELSSAGASGRQSFACVINLATGARKTLAGSWGGPNPWSHANVIDAINVDTSYTIPPDGAVILGSRGESVYATIHVAPATLAPMLPKAPELTEFDQQVLAAFRGLTSAGRKNEFERWESDACYGRKPGSMDSYGEYTPARGRAFRAELSATIDRLVSAGLLKRNAAGSVQITTDGKNAIAGVR
jgi:hypothetical protein